MDRIDTVTGSDEEANAESETSSSESEDDGQGQTQKRGICKKTTSKLQHAANGILREGVPNVLFGPSLVHTLLLYNASSMQGLQPIGPACCYQEDTTYLAVLRVIH